MSLADNGNIPVRVSMFTGGTKASSMFSVKEFGNQCLLYVVDKVLEYYSGGSWNYTFTDETLGDQAVKVEHNPKANPTSDKYSIWESGYFEKDGAVYNYLYYRYEDVPEEIGTQLIKDVLANMYEYTEE